MTKISLRSITDYEPSSSPDQFAQAWERHLGVMQACRAEVDKARAELAAMTDDSQLDVAFPWNGPCTDMGPDYSGYVWTPTPIDEVYKPTPEQAKEAEQARVWSLVELFARGG